MKQFCKNQKTRSKKGERTNEGKIPKREQVKNQKVPVEDSIQTRIQKIL